jgi:gamma-glutamylcysteine synthetase
MISTLINFARQRLTASKTGTYRRGVEYAEERNETYIAKRDFVLNKPRFLFQHFLSWKLREKTLKYYDNAALLKHD